MSMFAHHDSAVALVNAIKTWALRALREYV